jgi:hypothetical protein
MEERTRIKQADIQEAHEMRALEVEEPLYGLAPEPGGGGPESTGDIDQPRMEVPVEEPEEPYEHATNLTWGIVLGGVLLLFLVVAILYLGIGNTYSSQPFTTYPLK